MLPWRKRGGEMDAVLDTELDETADAEVVQLHPAPVHGEIEVLDEAGDLGADATGDPGTDLEPWQPRSALALRVDALAQRPIVLPREHLTAAAGWYARKLWRDTCWLATHPLHLPARELRPIARGVHVTWMAWRDWVTEAELAEAIEAAPKDSASRLTLSKQRAEARSGHRRMSFVVALLLLIGLSVAWWLVPFWLLERWPIPAWLVETPLVPDWLAAPWFVPDWMVAGAVLVAAVFDLVGRRHPDLDAPPPPTPRMPLEPGMPLGHLGEQILDCLREQNVRVEKASQMWVHAGVEYRINLQHDDPIKQEHLRAVERYIAARPLSVRLTNDGRDAGVSQLRVQTSDSLAGVRVAEFFPTGSLSCLDYLPLGRAGGEQPCSLRLVGVQTAVVGRTRSGKTEGAIWTIIDRLSACRDAVIWGIDLQNGPAFPMWRGVIQEVAYDPESAERLLHMALDEIGRRMSVLRRLAESDEDDTAGTTWTPDLGNYLFIIIDEFALTAAYDGKGEMKDEPNLVKPLKDIIRISLKVGVHLILASQKTGNSDFGDSVISSQVSTKILLACLERDTVTLLSTTQRDQGWAPHLLQPFQSKDDPRDAGVAYIESPVHSMPERYKFDFWPEGEVKRRARQRLADGLPALDDSASYVIADAVEVPEILAQVKKTFERLDYPSNVPTSEILSDLGAEWNSRRLAAELAPFGMEPTQFRPDSKANPVRGYARDALDDALRSL
jgi:hypothetical protein